MIIAIIGQGSHLSTVRRLLVQLAIEELDQRGRPAPDIVIERIHELPEVNVGLAGTRRGKGERKRNRKHRWGGDRS